MQKLCIVLESLKVRIVVFCGKGQLYITSAFSPNNDGLNDRFYIKGYGIASMKRMMIFKRYGQTVFEKQNVTINYKSEGWGCTYPQVKQVPMFMY